jgi:hypothetical protein
MTTRARGRDNGMQRRDAMQKHDNKVGAAQTTRRDMMTRQEATTRQDVMVRQNETRCDTTQRYVTWRRKGKQRRDTVRRRNNQLNKQINKAGKTRGKDAAGGIDATRGEVGVREFFKIVWMGGGGSYLDSHSM